MKVKGGKDAIAAFLFDAVVLNFPIEGQRLFDMYTGTFVIKNSTVNAPCSTVVQFDNSAHFLRNWTDYFKL